MQKIIAFCLLFQKFEHNLTHSKMIYGAHCYYCDDKDHTLRIHDGLALHQPELYAMCTHNYHNYWEMNPFEKKKKKILFCFKRTWFHKKNFYFFQHNNEMKKEKCIHNSNKISFTNYCQFDHVVVVWFLTVGRKYQPRKIQ